jgi:hypothetical protein
MLPCNNKRCLQPQAIFLVGGFGSSQYLKKRLEQANSDIQVIQPPDAYVVSTQKSLIKPCTYMLTFSGCRWGAIVKSVK